LKIRPAVLSDDQSIASFNQAMALETEAKHLPDKVILAGVRRQLADPSLKALASQHDDVIGIRLYAEKENTRAIRTYLRLGMTETPYRLLEDEFAELDKL